MTDAAGEVATVVLKAAKPAALISNLEREWWVGRKLTSLQQDDGDLPGFMKVGPALRTRDGRMIGESHPRFVQTKAETCTLRVQVHPGRA